MRGLRQRVLWLPIFVAICLIPGLGLAGHHEKGEASEGSMEAKKKPVVVMETSKGTIKIELDEEKAPATVANFLQYVDDGFYDGTVFHRVVPNFVIQGGGFDEGGKRKSTRSPIKNEADNGLPNKRGTLSMARTRDINSATSQFFVNLVDNKALDHGTRDFGYAVFGRVTEGMDVVDAIAAPGARDLPNVNGAVVIVSAKRAE